MNRRLHQVRCKTISTPTYLNEPSHYCVRGGCWQVIPEEGFSLAEASLDYGWKKPCCWCPCSQGNDIKVES